MKRMLASRLFSPINLVESRWLFCMRKHMLEELRGTDAMSLVAVLYLVLEPTWTKVAAGY